MIYHIADIAAWEHALLSTHYSHPTLASEGFIHCSTEAQLVNTMNRHFAEQTELLVLTIVEKFVRTKLKWEESSHNETFPHIYGRIPLEAVETISKWAKNAEGVWEKE
ncbi:MAG: DUF952 domain-containing protein [Bacteroidia bacterium]